MHVREEKYRKKEILGGEDILSACLVRSEQITSSCIVIFSLQHMLMTSRQKTFKTFCCLPCMYLSIS